MDIIDYKQDDYKLSYGRGYVYSLQYHIVWCTKYRRKVLKDGIDLDCKELIIALSEEYGFKIIAMEVMPDHVHLFVEIDPRVPLHQFIKSLKGRSSRILREEFPWLKSRIPSLWTRSYFCCTIGHISEDTIRRYIEAQKHV